MYDQTIQPMQTQVGMTRPVRIINYQIPGLNRVISITPAVGKEAVKLRELQKKMQNTLKNITDEDLKSEKNIELMSSIVAEFTSFENAQDVAETLTDIEIMEVYFSILGELDSVKKVLALSK